MTASSRHFGNLGLFCFGKSLFDTKLSVDPLSYEHLTLKSLQYMGINNPPLKGYEMYLQMHLCFIKPRCS
jgi:hypothetical protein